MNFRETRMHASAPREVLTKEQRTKQDETDDRVFYQYPRLVTHVDDTFIGKVTELYRQRIPPYGTVLDLGSSWISHLPGEIEYKRVIGHGLNAAELARNDRLDSFFVQNLNKEPQGWSLESGTVDAVVCCVSVQYFQQPEKVFAEVHRVLKPGGVVIVTFSNRMFGNKAIRAWTSTSDYGRCQLVRSYFQAIEGYERNEVLKDVQPTLKPITPSGPFAALSSAFRNLLGASSDPFFAVIAYKL